MSRYRSAISSDLCLLPTPDLLVARAQELRQSTPVHPGRSRRPSRVCRDRSVSTSEQRIRPSSRLCSMRYPRSRRRSAFSNRLTSGSSTSSRSRMRDIEACGQQRVAAQGEEVVVNADRLDAQHVAPQPRQHRLQFRPRRHRRAPHRRPARHRQPRVRRPYRSIAAATPTNRSNPCGTIERGSTSPKRRPPVLDQRASDADIHRRSTRPRPSPRTQSAARCPAEPRPAHRAFTDSRQRRPASPRSRPGSTRWPRIFSWLVAPTRVQRPGHPATAGHNPRCNTSPSVVTPCRRRRAPPGSSNRRIPRHRATRISPCQPGRPVPSTQLDLEVPATARADRQLPGPGSALS